MSLLSNREEMEFRRALLRVAGEIGSNDLDKLKFACSDQIPESKRERIHSPTELFVALEEKGLIAPNNFDYLVKQLQGIGRPALLSHFVKFGFTVAEMSKPQQQQKSDESPESRLNKLLLVVAEKLTCSEIDRLAFAWCHSYLNKTPDQIHTAFQLFTLMTQRLAISPENLDVLFIELSEMGRQDLCRAIEDYYVKHGIKHGLYCSPMNTPNVEANTPSSVSTASTPFSSNHEYPEFPSSESPSTFSTSASTSSRPQDLSFTSSSEISTPSSEQSTTSVDNPTPVGARHNQKPGNFPPVEQRFKPEEGNSVVMGELYRKQQEVKKLKERLEMEQNQRRLESQQSSSIVDQHQNHIIMLQEALAQKNQEIQVLYKEFMEQNISNMQNISLNHPTIEEYYPMSCHPHGYCVIFNNYQFYQVDENHEQLMERGGADVDQRTLSDTFKFLQYNVEVYENLPSNDIVSRMKEISSRDHSQFDSFICCILTHGEEGKIFGSDSLPVNLQDMTGLVKGTFCPTLVDKPKLFFVQACRGEREDKGVPIEKDGPASLPVEADYLFGYATPTGKAAYRSRRHGSWFISELCNVFNNNAHLIGLSAMMKKVNRSVSEAYTKEGYKQCTEVVDRLRREVKFLPSYPQNNTS